METELQAWQDSLPADLKLDGLVNSTVDPRAALELEMHRCSIGMLLYRLCLCSIEIHGESASSRAFNARCAKACVEAALDLLNLMPDEPLLGSQIYQVLPWWSVLHYICQAASVLLLELCLSVQHLQGESHRVLDGMTKAMTLIQCFSRNSKSAYKASVILRALLVRVLPRYRSNMLADIPQTQQKPSSWNSKDDAVMRTTMQALR